MKSSHFLATLALSLIATGAWAQNAGKPLNLKLPPTDFPPPASTAPAPAKDAPGTYYGDHSTRIQTDDEYADGTPRCDDATYNKPQVHGSVSTGVVSSSRGGSGSYQAGTVNLSQRFGDCDHPTGGVSISVGGGTGHFSGRGR
ncbi:hypothetical protein [Luteibacter rhizovicinus]|nr:hypothetical protein [Luteibacter rhizovicinus]